VPFAASNKTADLQARGFIGSRERHGYQFFGFSCTLALENLVPGTGKAARLVALSQADPQLPMPTMAVPVAGLLSLLDENAGKILLFSTTAK